MQIQTHSPEETEAVGRKLAAQLQPGDVLAYYNRLYHYCDYRGGVKHENEKICSFDAHPLHDALPEHFGVCGQ